MVRKNSCGKCGNKSLVREQLVGCGITARPCPICGHQNYSFPAGMKQTSGTAESAEERACYDCGETGIGAHARYCKRCIIRRQWIARKNYWEKQGLQYG